MCRQFPFVLHSIILFSLIFFFSSFVAFDVDAGFRFFFVLCMSLLLCSWYCFICCREREMQLSTHKKKEVIEQRKWASWFELFLICLVGRLCWHCTRFAASWMWLWCGICAFGSTLISFYRFPRELPFFNCVSHLLFFLNCWITQICISPLPINGQRQSGTMPRNIYRPSLAAEYMRGSTSIAWPSNSSTTDPDLAISCHSSQVMLIAENKNNAAKILRPVSIILRPCSHRLLWLQYRMLCWIVSRPGCCFITRIIFSVVVFN